jgi:prepilin-type N-terminal cleavage/methylation domain-containing protein
MRPRVPETRNPEPRLLQSQIVNRKSQTVHAFTLVEMLVSISIIVLLAGLLLVAVTRIYKQGSKARATADLASIATALDAYKQDFGSYPPVDTTNTGAAVLAKALIGPSPKPVDTGSANLGQFKVGSVTPRRVYISLTDNNSGAPPVSPLATSDWAQIDFLDGADGAPPDYREPGFRVGPKTLDKFLADGVTPGQDGIPETVSGEVRRPYLQPDKFITRPDSGMLLDSQGNPILYFPAATAKPDISKVNNYVSDAGRPLFDANDNVRFFVQAPEATTNNAVERIQVILGDFGANGAIDKQSGMEQEQAAADSQAYLLWSAGGDGIFGPNNGPGAPAPMVFTPSTLDDWKKNKTAAEKCDDVTNFR